MKTSRFFRLLAIFMGVLMGLESCSIYHKSTASLDEAVDSQARTKLVMENNSVYKFRSIQEEDGEYYGLARKNSATAKELGNAEREIKADHNDKLKSFLINSESVKEVHLKNESLSTLVSIVVPLFIALVSIVIVSDFDFGDNYML